MRLPVSEIFQSIQGEGALAGVPMLFIRFAGCSVGSPIPVEEKHGAPVYVEHCRTWDDRQFRCDTDFRVKERLSVDEIMERIPDNGIRVCFTGGEPLIHNLSSLTRSVLHRGHCISVETSGTILIPDYLVHNNVWLAISPKEGALNSVITIADEIKFLVDENFDMDKVLELIEWRGPFVYLQPVNRRDEVDEENLNRCISLLKEHPHLRLSTQMHKVWKVR